MAPPRLPQEYAERLITILLGIPAIAGQGRRGWQAFIAQAHTPREAWDWLDVRQPPRTVATHLIGSAANLVPAYDGPRRGWTDLGALLAVLIADPAVPVEARAYMAALVVRYRLLPLDAPDLAPGLQAALAAVPPQPPPVYPPTMPMPPGDATPPG